MSLRPEADGLPRICLAQYGEAHAFGPIVTCAVMLDEVSAVALADLSRTDWTQMSAIALSRAARRISAVVPYEPVQLTPRKFNTLLNKVSGRGKVLNWAYKTALTAMFERYPECKAASYDVNAPEFAVLTTDLPRTPGLAFVFRSLSEPEPGLAAAGLLARAYFEKVFAELERKAGEPLSRGAEDPSTCLGRLFDKGGGPLVFNVAKKDDPRVQLVIAAGKAAG